MATADQIAAQIATLEGLRANGFARVGIPDYYVTHRISIEALVGGPDPEGALDALIESICETLGADPTLGGAVLFSELALDDLETAGGDGAAAITSALLALEVEYASSRPARPGGALADGYRPGEGSPARHRRGDSAADGLPPATAQLTTFRTFLQADLQDRALSFSWTHPVTGAAGWFRIVDPPQYEPAGPSWRVAVVMEMLP